MAKQIRVQHILVEHLFEIEDLQRKLKEGSAFDALARTFSKCASRVQGGDLGSLGRGRTVPAFEEAAFALEIDDISGPVRTQFGYHLIRRTE